MKIANMTHTIGSYECTGYNENSKTYMFLVTQISENSDRFGS